MYRCSSLFRDSQSLSASLAQPRTEDAEFTIFRFTQFKWWPNRRRSSTGGAEDGVKASGKRAFPMVSRSWLFSGTERRAAALLPPHCFPKPPHAADRPVYHPRLPHMENGLENRLQRRAEGCPRGRGVAPQMMKIHASGLAICMDRAGVASTRNLA
jgi:hypothetical protein